MGGPLVAITNGRCNTPPPTTATSSFIIAAMLIVVMGVTVEALPSVVMISVEDLLFKAVLDWDSAPVTCGAFVENLPWSSTLLQARWSGEAGWIPMGNNSWARKAENATSTPVAGQLLYYPHGISETEILFPFGVSRFGSKFGPLLGSPFLNIVDGQQNYDDLAHRLEWNGAQGNV